MADDSKNSRIYHVLSLIEADDVISHIDSDVYRHVCELEASSTEQAIRLAATECGPGTYVAVPARSWAPITVRVETPAPRVILDGNTEPARQDTLA